MEYVVIRAGGKQYKVSKGSIIEVDRLFVDKDKEIILDDVLLWVSNGNIQIGKPKVSDIRVKAKVLEHKKGEKIRVAKFKAKVRYRRVMGFRPLLTRLEIVDIGSSETKEKPKISSLKTPPKRSARRKIS